MSIASVTRELLVRYLDIWTPTALHASRRATFAQAWHATPDADTATAALRVFAEFADRLRGHELTVVLVAPHTGELADRLDRAQAELGTPRELTVHALSGEPDAQLPVALSAVAAAGSPLLAYVDAPRSVVDGADRPVLRAVASGRTAELLLVTTPGDWRGLRPALHAAGFGLTAGIDLVAPGEPTRLLAFGTSSGKRLEAFKDALWSVDEYAGVRYRDPRDPDGDLLDISLTPQPAPLRRELLAHLNDQGFSTVADIRRYTLTDTVYRSSDTARALSALLASGALVRSPEQGRLSGDVVVAPAPAGPSGGSAP